MEISAYLASSDIVDFEAPEVQKIAKLLKQMANSEIDLIKRSFEYVRDQISHTGDQGFGLTSVSASDVLRNKTGWCYAKSHLLAALLRANQVPCGFDYQRLSCSEYKKDVYCLHGLNTIYLEGTGWYRVDARGNKEGVNAQFVPPKEQLAFDLEAQEFDLKLNLAEPLEEVISALKRNVTYQEMVQSFPDYQL